MDITCDNCSSTFTALDATYYVAETLTDAIVGYICPHCGGIVYSE